MMKKTEKEKIKRVNITIPMSPITMKLLRKESGSCQEQSVKLLKIL